MDFKNKRISIPEPDFVTNLNEQQRIAVSQTDGPLLVLSGAGTGKTKVLTTRLANLIYKRLAKTNEIFAVTFTNKAALEMKQRVEKILNIPVEGMFIGTFHSIGVRFLRKHSSLVNLKNDFTILDTSDQLRLLKQVISFLNLDEKRYVPKNFLYMIDQAKNLGLFPEDIKNHEFEIKTDGKFGIIYKAYQERLKNFNSVVDEYQDTNGAQYMLLRLLTGEKRNICCVGDEDQSIYGWRGAQLKNILNFDRDFLDAKIIRLEQNYRSTGNILKTASSLISENEERIGKDLWTSDSNGEPVKILNLENDEAEALYIAKEIRTLVNNKVKLSDIAILTRASFQFKDIEDRFLKEGIKYRVVGGLRFYERAEIKDALSYFRLLINKSDNLAFERIINIPKRGMGKAFIQKLYGVSNKENTSLFEALGCLVDSEDMKNQQLSKSKQFLQILNNHSKMLDKDNHSEVAGSLLEEVGYIEMLQADKTPEAEGKLENLKKLVSDIKNRNSIHEFLEEVSLLTDILNNSDGLEKISLMTLHSAKGLEFNYVFLPGWEEGIFPNQRSLDENGNKGLEEERRLGYVGITRARRFLSELPDDSCKVLQISTKEKKDKQKLSSLVNTNFNIGDKVFHEQFGKGLVLGISENQLHIRFENDEKVIKIFSDYIKKI